MDKRFTGMIPPVVTPFTAEGEVDLEALDRVIEHLIEGGMNGLFILGSSGEVAYLNDAQRDAVTARTVATAAGRVPVLVGAIETTAKRVIDRALRAQELGADAIVAAGPFYALPSAADLPLFAYDVPVRLGGLKLGRDMLVELGKEGVIVGVKDSSGDDVGFRRLVAANEAAGHPLSLLTGHECVVDGMLLLGADGAVPGYGNVDPRSYAQLLEAARAHEWDKAREIQDRICAGFEIVFAVKGQGADGTGIPAFKTAMEAVGVLDNAYMAPPVKALEGENRQRVIDIVHAVGLA